MIAFVDLVNVDVLCMGIMSGRPTGSAPFTPTPFLERPRKGGKKSPLRRHGGLAPADSTIEVHDDTGDNSRCLPTTPYPPWRWKNNGARCRLYRGQNQSLRFLVEPIDR